MELLLLLASDAIEEHEMIAKHERRGVYLALYYIGLASSDGASAATKGDADASVDGMMDVDSADVVEPFAAAPGRLTRAAQPAAQRGQRAAPSAARVAVSAAAAAPPG